MEREHVGQGGASPSSRGDTSARRKGRLASPSQGRHLADFRGMYAVALEQGRLIGWVVGAYLDPGSRAVSGLKLRRGILARQEVVVPTSAVTLVGDDVVLVTDADALSAVEALGDALGEPMDEVIGLPVFTRSGTHLGQLEDIEVATDTWVVTELWLKGGRHLPVNAPDVIFSASVVLPEEYADRIAEREGRRRAGFWGRLFQI